MRRYGAMRNFPGRLDDLAKAFDSYRIRNPDQEIEGAFDRLIEEVRKFYDRRNEVAHGVVMPISNFHHFRRHLTNKSQEPPQFAVIPPYHLHRGHGPDGLPVYAYTSASLHSLLEELMRLWDRLKSYRATLLLRKLR
jgi:hypothetical protein